MDKLSKYIDNSSELEKNSIYSIKARIVEDEYEVRTRRQNFRIYILFGVLVF